jgi:hypothetical protein
VFSFYANHDEIAVARNVKKVVEKNVRKRSTNAFTSALSEPNSFDSDDCAAVNKL